jgi:hypothetical protein
MAGGPKFVRSSLVSGGAILIMDTRVQARGLKKNADGLKTNILGPTAKSEALAYAAGSQPKLPFRYTRGDFYDFDYTRRECS